MSRTNTSTAWALLTALENEDWQSAEGIIAEQDEAGSKALIKTIAGWTSALLEVDRLRGGVSQEQQFATLGQLFAIRDTYLTEPDEGPG